MTNRIYCYDTEFLEDGKTIELISIGIVCDDGSEYYAVNSDMPIDRIIKHDWLLANVWKHLPLYGYNEHLTGMAGSLKMTPKHLGSLDRSNSAVKPKWVIANEVRDFITDCIAYGDSPQLWADYGAYDHVVLAQLFGPMISLPKGIPMFTHDLQQLRESLPGAWKAPEQESGLHDALEDARHNMCVYQAAMKELSSRVQ